MPLGWRSVTPKIDPFARFGKAGARVREALRDFGSDAVQDLADYPEAATAYVRTGRLGQSWKMHGPKVRAGSLVVTASNKRVYAAKVQGPKQSELFERLEWPTVTKVAGKQWDAHKPDILDALQNP